MLRAESLSVSYQNHAEPVLRDIQLELQPGKLIALIGPNGAAKSTLLRALAGVLSKRSGSITIEAQPLESLTRLQLARKLAYSPQQSLVPFAFSSQEVAAMGRYVHGDEREESGLRAVAEALASVDAAAFAARIYNELSGGEKQRVCLARSLAQRCPILLLDEPTSAQDLAHKILIFQELRARCDAGLAALVATHDLNIAAAYADFFVILHKGREYARGSAKDMLSAEILRDVFSVESWIGVTPHEVPFAIPLRRRVPE